MMPSPAIFLFLMTVLLLHSSAGSTGIKIDGDYRLNSNTNTNTPRKVNMWFNVHGDKFINQTLDIVARHPQSLTGVYLLNGGDDLRINANGSVALPGGGTVEKAVEGLRSINSDLQIYVTLHIDSQSIVPDVSIAMSAIPAALDFIYKLDIDGVMVDYEPLTAVTAASFTSSHSPSSPSSPSSSSLPSSSPLSLESDISPAREWTDYFVHAIPSSYITQNKRTSTMGNGVVASTTAGAGTGSGDIGDDTKTHAHAYALFLQKLVDSNNARRKVRGAGKDRDRNIETHYVSQGNRERTVGTCVSSWGILMYFPMYVDAGVDAMMTMASTYSGVNITSNEYWVDRMQTEHVSLRQLQVGIGSMQEKGHEDQAKWQYDWSPASFDSFLQWLNTRNVRTLALWRSDINSVYGETAQYMLDGLQTFLSEDPSQNQSSQRQAQAQTPTQKQKQKSSPPSMVGSPPSPSTAFD